MRQVLALLVMVSLTGCANKILYDWAGFNSGVEGHFTTMLKHDVGAISTEQTLEIVSNHVARNNEKGLKVPPGVYAELGTLYLEENNLSQAIFFYRQEQITWPESSVLMEKLIDNLSKQ